MTDADLSRLEKRHKKIVANHTKWACDSPENSIQIVAMITRLRSAEARVRELEGAIKSSYGYVLAHELEGNTDTVLDLLRHLVPSLETKGPQ